MASIEEEGTRGKHLSYKIRVCLGRDENGRQISKAMRWNPPEDMTPAKAKKEAQRVAAVWEAEQKEAFERQKAQQVGRKTDYTFGQFVDEVWVPLCVRDGSHRSSTVAMYTNILKVMRPHFVELLLSGISGIQITQYLTWLRNDYRTQYGKPLAEKSAKHHYYTYNTMGAGYAGTAYLADATGQLKVVKEVASYTSTANPFSVDLVYNSDYFVNRTSTYLPHGSAMNFGSGWTLDCVQTLASQAIGGREYLRYTDGDGTEHYFLKDSSKDSGYYYDEDGLGLKIKAVSGGYGTYTYGYDTKYNLTSVTDGHVTQNMTYSAQGNVTNTSLKGGSLTMTSSARYDANGNRLLSVTDNAGATVKYAYSGELSKMLALPESVTDALGNTTTNIYDNFGRITETSLANGSGVVYTYTKGQLSELSRRTGSTTQNYSFVYNSFGRMTELKVGSRTLAKYEYAIGNGNLTKQTYGNGASVVFTYDQQDRVTTRTTSDGSQAHTYTYGDASWKDLLTAYDGHAISYDRSGNPTTYYNGQAWTFGWTGSRTLASAGSREENQGTDISYGYDLDGLRTGKTVTKKVYHTHAYTETRTVAPTCTADGYTLHQCACGDSYKTDFVSALGHNFEFTKTEKPTCTTSGYTLETCTKCGETQKTNVIAALGHNWSRDISTNTRTCVRCKKVEEAIVVPPQPTESQSVMDEGEAPDETIPPETGETASEEPVQPEGDASVDVQATSQTIASEATTAYSYIYASGKLLQEKVTTDGTTETHNFFYDNTGKPYAMQVNGTTYYYVTNLQGDVMGLVDTSGNSVASYTYDPYGKVLTATGTLAEKNPLRYRGYYYDSESGLYYLQSRYYDPAVRRFVNADSYASTGQGILGQNMFAYCSNCPTISCDPLGLWTISISITLAGVLGIGISVSIGLAIDDDGNTDVQYSYSIPGIDDTVTVGGVSAGIGIAAQYTTADTVYDLYGPATYIGASGGPGWYVGADVVSFSDASDSNMTTDGFQITAGLGGGVDVHITESYTRSCSKWNSSSRNSLFGGATREICLSAFN